MRDAGVEPSLSDGRAIADSLDSPDAFGVVFERHFDAIHRYLARRGGVALADDLSAQVFAEAFASRGRFDLRRENAAPWLYGIATNLLRRHHRREAARWRAFAKHGVDPISVDDGSDAHASRDAAEVAVARVLARLPADERDAFLLSQLAELTYEEIAVVQGVPLGTVRSRVNRARTRMRAALEGVRE